MAGGSCDFSSLGAWVHPGCAGDAADAGATGDGGAEGDHAFVKVEIQCGGENEAGTKEGPRGGALDAREKYCRGNESWSPRGHNT